MFMITASQKPLMAMRQIIDALKLQLQENFNPFKWPAAATTKSSAEPVMTSIETSETSETDELHLVFDTQIAEEVYCSICMESKLLDECLTMKGCSHMFCNSCTAQYVVAKLEENVGSIQCPDTSCKEGVLEPEMCLSILPKDVFEWWGRVLCESSISEASKLYCPYKDCMGLMIDEWGANGELTMEAECPHCGRVFHVHKVRKARDDPMLREMAEKSKWQKCPACGVYVEKIDGCLYIGCRCGHGFCYGCASPLVEHYCQKCQGKL